MVHIPELVARWRAQVSRSERIRAVARVEEHIDRPGSTD